MEAVMKSIIPAALVVVLEAGFLFSIASLPSPAGRVEVEMVSASAARLVPDRAAELSATSTQGRRT
ncbi:MAG TPA: hypothetical protein VFP50_15800 [Anaeromyxobacteraceae bacterium]|nr:hypothetical protein [Anaeromyxobacteraceae bacterium]